MYAHLVVKNVSLCTNIASNTSKKEVGMELLKTRNTEDYDITN